MSINFPSDNPAPRRKKGGGIFFLVLFVGIAFMVLRGMNPTGPPATENLPQTDRGVNGNAQYPQAKLPPANGNPSDWSAEDGPVHRNLPKSSSSQIDQGGNDGWEMQDVATKKNNKSTVKTSGDWSAESKVDVKKKSAPKKTTRDDWSLEEIDN